MNLSALPKKGARVVVAMSGGVDSSVAAAWLKQQGYQVIGISLQLHDYAAKDENKFGTCCSLSDIQDARRVCEKIGVPFYVKDMETEFNKAVIDDFVNEYLSGRTPNPCVRCNEKVKFSRLMDWALDMGADYLATGHYAGIRHNTEENRFDLIRGEDPSKDQSYFLFTIQQEDLARTLFPIGQFEKPRVRALASEYGLDRVAKKPDSQEICFVQGTSYKDFVAERAGPRDLEPGTFVTPQGKVLGQHAGIHGFTIGQRKGITVAHSEPLYVLEIRKESREVVVGEESYLFRRKAIARNFHWIWKPDLKLNSSFEAKVRYRSTATPVTVRVDSETEVTVEFAIPQRAVTPGQALVLYQGDVVVGGGWIERLPLEV